VPIPSQVHSLHLLQNIHCAKLFLRGARFKNVFPSTH